MCTQNNNIVVPGKDLTFLICPSWSFCGWYGHIPVISQYSLL